MKPEAALLHDCKLGQLRPQSNCPLALRSILLPTADTSLFTRDRFHRPRRRRQDTLLDELVLRFLNAAPDGGLAILSKISSPRQGALLADRASRFMHRPSHSCAETRGHTGGAVIRHPCLLDVLRHAGFDLVLVETAALARDVPSAEPGR